MLIESFLGYSCPSWLKTCFGTERLHIPINLADRRVSKFEVGKCEKECFIPETSWVTRRDLLRRTGFGVERMVSLSILGVRSDQA